MKNKRCINIKRSLIDFIELNFKEFIFEDSSNSIYIFKRCNKNKIYDYIFIQKDFYEGEISLTISEVASCYNSNWRGIPHCIIGYETNIACLITKNKVYDSNVRWHKCQNNKDDLQRIFLELKKDINEYVLPFFKESHQKINEDTVIKLVKNYIIYEAKKLTDDEVNSIKKYIKDCNLKYSKYIKECRINNKQILNYFEVVKDNHKILQKWEIDIIKNLNKHISTKTKLDIKKYILILFKDLFDFYNLK